MECDDLNRESNSLICFHERHTTTKNLGSTCGNGISEYGRLLRRTPGDVTGNLDYGRPTVYFISAGQMNMASLLHFSFAAVVIDLRVTYAFTGARYVGLYEMNLLRAASVIENDLAREAVDTCWK